MLKDTTGLLYDLFANLLSYPTADLPHQAETCLAQLQPIHPDAAAALEKFSATLANRSRAQNEELYTVTFDMQPVCYPYVGYHLFGENYKRGAFMAQLNEAYHAFGYFAGDELPDHVPAILRFLALDSANRQGDFCQALLNEGLLPALGKMRQAFGEQSENPYASLLAALQLFLAPAPEKEFDHA
jgi:nitrate reductase delta subunit